MIELYPQIRIVHIVAVLFSGGLFVLRGLFSFAGRKSWATAAPVRYLSYSVDTVLLMAALMLVSILPPAVFANGWLAAKLGLLVGYIVLGVLTFRLAEHQPWRRVCFALAVLAFIAMLSVARRHHPLGHLV